jgi:VanZ family protein
MANDRGLKYWLSAWIPVAVGAVVICLESTEWMGADHTTGPLRWLFQMIFGPIGNARWEVVHSLIRKSGHFIGYGGIGLTWLRAWWMTLPRSGFLEDAALALLGTALMAGADEYHQTFLPNRTGSLRDVILDCCGAIVLLVVAYILVRLFRPRKLA